ncbi:MAG: hypothetical protein INH41_10795 [Myxococcaceae bacterium]|jgi:hypothetical protein|nr:hypothetical protein [Myxococcaceae bacterium]MCA3012873.1 hypothetical protein [Myxococcaceae bacterium]
MRESGYSVLRVDDGGRLPLRRLHAERLGPGAGPALARFARRAAPGVYRATWNGEALTVTARGPSRLRDGLPTRLVPSPFAHVRGRFPKPAPPSPYEAVRLDGMVSLLTDEGGHQLYEACVAGLVAWSGAALVLPPEDAPAVASVAERAIAERLSPQRAPLLVSDRWPLLLVNAAVGTCAPAVPGRGAFPADVRARLDALLASEDA